MKQAQEKPAFGAAQHPEDTAGGTLASRKTSQGGVSGLAANPMDGQRTRRSNSRTLSWRGYARTPAPERRGRAQEAAGDTDRPHHRPGGHRAPGQEQVRRPQVSRPNATTKKEKPAPAFADAGSRLT